MVARYRLFLAGEDTPNTFHRDYEWPVDQPFPKKRFVRGGNVYEMLEERSFVIEGNLIEHEGYARYIGLAEPRRPSWAYTRGVFVSR